jgi:hypothetical protein
MIDAPPSVRSGQEETFRLVGILFRQHLVSANLTVGTCPGAFATIAIHLRHGHKRSIQAQWLEVLPEKRRRAEIAAL